MVQIVFGADPPIVHCRIANQALKIGGLISFTPGALQCQWIVNYVWHVCLMWYMTARA